MAETEHLAKIQALRTVFADLYKDNIIKNSYDERDLKRFQEQDVYTLRFIFHQQFDIKKAAAMADASLKFRKEFGLNDLGESSFKRWMHELGAVYYRNKDKEGRDILFFQVCKNKKDTENMFKVKQFIAWWIDKRFSKWPEKQIVVLFDMTNVGLSNVDIELIKYQVSCFSTYFPGMLAYMLVYEMPWVLNAIWKLIKNLLTPEQQKRVLFVKKNEIQQYISADNLPVHMGGTDDVEYKYLPSEDSGIDIPNDEDTPGSPILNGDVTDDQHFATSVPNESDPSQLTNSGSSASSITSSTSATTSSSSSSGSSSSSTSSVRKRVTFSEQGDTHIPADDNMPSVSTSSRSSDSTKAKTPTNQTAFQNPIVTLRPADQLMFYVTDEGRETQDTISVSNNSSNTLAFKIKTTSPESFRVRPSTGLVRPGETTEIFVYLQPGCYDNVTREKFLVMLMQVDEGTKLSSLGEKWKSPPNDPEKYFEHRLWCAMRRATESQQEDSLARCEEVLTTLTQQVNEIVKSQKRLETRLCRLYTFQIVLALVLFLCGLALFLAFVLDIYPFSEHGGGLSACAPYMRGS